MIVLTGLSHRTADISIREEVAFSAEEEATLTRSLIESGVVAEVFVVSTCNRVEIVARSVADSDQSVRDCVEICREALVKRSARAQASVYAHRDLEAVRHLVRVACSLDSLVVGEAQIMGQIKKGYERARKLDAVGSGLHQLLMRVVRGAKRVRNETSIGMGQVSVPSIAIDLAQQIFGDLSGRHAVMIGAGEMGQAVARLLRDAGAIIKVVGRTMERARPLAESIGASAHAVSELEDLLVEAEVVVSSTSSSEPVLTRGTLVKRYKKRRAANLFCIDLAVPRDIEPSVGKLDGVFLYDVDDLSEVAEQSTKLRQKEAEAAQAIVEQVVGEWDRHTHAQQVTPTIKALRAKLRLGLEVEFNKSLKSKLRDLDPSQRLAIARMLDAGINRVLHSPITHLRQEASRSDPAAEEFAGMLSELFELSQLSEDELDVPSVRVHSMTSTSIAPSSPEHLQPDALDESEQELSSVFPPSATHLR